MGALRLRAPSVASRFGVRSKRDGRSGFLTMIQVAVLGAGHWGPNLIRNFDNRLRSEVRWVADLDAGRLEMVRQRFPGVRVTHDANEAIADPLVDAVVVATPTSTHFELVKRALLAGKHVLVEKPLTPSSDTSRELVELAQSRSRVLLVGHVFVYNPAVQWVKRRLATGEMGRVFYLSSERTNLGPIRLDVNAAWDLAAQDVAIFNDWLDCTPVSAVARGHAWINPGIEDAVFAVLRYPRDVLVHLHVSWLNPRKVRDITVVAERKMLTYDDMNLNEPIRVYDKQVAEDRVHPQFVDSYASFRASIHEGDVTIPRVRMGEPLKIECDHFLDCVERGVKPMTDGKAALAVVLALEAMDRSLRRGGVEVEVGS